MNALTNSGDNYLFCSPTLISLLWTFDVVKEKQKKKGFLFLE